MTVTCSANNYIANLPTVRKKKHFLLFIAHYFYFDYVFELFYSCKKLIDGVRVKFSICARQLVDAGNK